MLPSCSLWVKKDLAGCAGLGSAICELLLRVLHSAFSVSCPSLFNWTESAALQEEQKWMLHMTCKYSQASFFCILFACNKKQEDKKRKIHCIKWEIESAISGRIFYTNAMLMWGNSVLFMKIGFIKCTRGSTPQRNERKREEGGETGQRFLRKDKMEGANSIISSDLGSNSKVSHLLKTFDPDGTRCTFQMSLHPKESLLQGQLNWTATQLNFSPALILWIELGNLSGLVDSSEGCLCVWIRTTWD